MGSRVLGKMGMVIKFPNAWGQRGVHMAAKEEKRNGCKQGHGNGHNDT